MPPAPAPALTTWGLGDYPRMAERLVPAAARAVAAADVVAGERVLDVACGTGNAALLAAAAGARVTGVDIEPRLLARARDRARAEALAVAWLPGDAEALPVPDRAFDVALSVFGAMNAPDQSRAARELARVAAPVRAWGWPPGGRVG